MTVITSKAVAAAKAAGLGPNFDFGSIVTIITQIFSALSACAPTAARVHQSISNPGLLQKISLRRTVRSHVGNPALRQAVEDGVLHVGKTSTVQETSTMFEEATGTKPK